MPYTEYYDDPDWLEYETIRQEIECGNRDPQDLEDFIDSLKQKEIDTEIRTTIKHAPTEWRAKDWDFILQESYEEPDILCRDLHIARGRPTGIVGPPGGGKSDLAQHIALAIASGTTVLERFPVTRRGRVLHISYDMGAWATAIRYRRLANGMRLSYEQLRYQIVLCAYPEVNLTSDKAVDRFCQMARGFDLVVLDNARMATPGIDENASLFGEHIGHFGQACEKVGAVGIYLHHTRKGGEAGIDAIRGSNSITAASGAIWYLEPTGGPSDARLCTHIRGHDVLPDMLEPFYIRHENPPVCKNFDVGVQALNPIRMTAEFVEERKATERMKPEDRECAILSFLSTDGWIGNAEVIKAVGGKTALVIQTLERLKTEGKVVDDHDDRKRIWKKI